MLEFNPFPIRHAPALVFRLASQNKRPKLDPHSRMVPTLQPELRKFSIAEYYKLAETGVLAPSERVELLNGQIIRMAPIGEKHRTIVDKLNYIFVDKPKKRYQVSIDQPIRIENFKGFWCKVLKGSVSRDNRRDDGTDFGTGTFQGPSL